MKTHNTSPPHLTYHSILGASLIVLSTVYLTSAIIYEATSKQRNDFIAASAAIHTSALYYISLGLSAVGAKRSAHKLSKTIHITSKLAAILGTILSISFLMFFIN